MIEETNETLNLALNRHDSTWITRFVERGQKFDELLENILGQDDSDTKSSTYIEFINKCNQEFSIFTMRL